VNSKPVDNPNDASEKESETNVEVLNDNSDRNENLNEKKSGASKNVEDKTTNDADDASKVNPTNVTNVASKVELAIGEAENVPVKNPEAKSVENPAKEPEVKTGQSSVKNPENNSEETQGNSEENSKVNIEGTIVNPEGTNKNPERTNENPEDTNKNPEGTNENPEATNENPEATNENPEDTNKNPEDTNKNPEDTNKNPEQKTDDKLAENSEENSKEDLKVSPENPDSNSEEDSVIAEEVNPKEEKPKDENTGENSEEETNGGNEVAQNAVETPESDHADDNKGELVAVKDNTKKGQAGILRQQDIDNGNFETPDDNGDAGNKDIIPDEELEIHDENNNKQPKVDGIETKVEDNLGHGGDDENTQGDNNIEPKEDGSKKLVESNRLLEEDNIETQGDNNRQLEEDNVEIAGGIKIEPIEEPEVNGEETQGANNLEPEENNEETQEDNNVEHEEDLETEDKNNEQREENDDDFEEHPDVVETGEDTNLNKPDVDVNNDEVKQGSLPDEPYKSNEDIPTGYGSFFYIMLLVLMAFGAYIMFHNKRKMLSSRRNPLLPTFSKPKVY